MKQCERKIYIHTIVVACEEGSYEALMALAAGFHTSKKLWIANVFVSWNYLQDHPTLASDYN